MKRVPAVVICVVGLVACLADRNLPCLGDGVRGGPHNYCMCPEGYHAVSERRCEKNEDAGDTGDDAGANEDGAVCCAVIDASVEVPASDAAALDAPNVDPGCEPVVEVCNGIDDDCDGVIDNGDAKNECGGPCSMKLPHKLGSSCNNGKLGICAASGKWVCSDVVLDGMVCDAIGNLPATADTCNGKDDDCNGLVDDIYNPQRVGGNRYSVECPGLPQEWTYGCTPPVRPGCFVMEISS